MHTITISEEEFDYIRKAVCKINLQYCIKAQNFKAEGKQNSYEIYMQMRNFGHTVLDTLDKQTEGRA